MWRARMEHDWAQTAEVLAMLYNVHRAKGPPLHGRDLNPAPRRPTGGGRADKPVVTVSVKALKGLFTGQAD